MVHKLKSGRISSGNTDEIADAFANGATSGHNYSDSMFIEGDTIYSYGHHFPIAVVDRKNKTAEFNEDKYSVTTGKHKSKVRGALLMNGFKLKPSNTAKMRGELVGNERGF